MYFPENKRLEVSRPTSEVLSVKPKLGRGRGLAISFNNGKSEKGDASSTDINMNHMKTKIQEARQRMKDRKSESSDTIASEDIIITCRKNEPDDDLEKTYSVIQCWPSVDDKIWNCWDKSKNDRSQDDDNDYLIDYAPLVASYSKASLTAYPKPKVASLEITGNEWPSVNNIPKISLYEPLPSYSLSLPINYLPRKYFNKLNNSRSGGEYSYRFDTGYDPSLSKKKVNEDKYSQFHKKVKAPYTRKINYWKSNEKNDKVVDKDSEVKDPVSALYIWCSRNRAIPTFTFTNEIEYEGKVIIGMVFVCKISLYDHQTVGKGTNKKESKRVASEKMLEIINSGFVEKKSEEKDDKKEKSESDEDVKIDSDDEVETDSDEEKKTDSEKVKKTESNKTEEDKSEKKKKNESDKKENTESDKKNKTDSNEEEKTDSDEDEKADAGKNEVQKTKSRKIEKGRSDKGKKAESDEKEDAKSNKEEETDSGEDEEKTDSSKDEVKNTKSRKTEKGKSDKKKKTETDEKEDAESGEKRTTESGKEEESYSDKEEEVDSGKVKSKKPKETKSDKKEAAKKNVKNLSEAEYKKHVNSIGFLQEVCMKEKWGLPDYKLESFGSIFKCQIHMFVKGVSIEESGFGHTKKEAKTKAAANVLVKICEDKSLLSKSE